MFSSRSGLVWIGSILAAVFLQTWESPSASRIPHILLLASLVAQQLGMPRAWRTIVSAVIRSGQVQREMKWARMELARCERVIARGGAAPLQEARDAVLRLMREQRGTLNLLQGFGYRAGLAGRCSHRTAGGDAAEPS